MKTYVNEKSSVNVHFLPNTEEQRRKVQEDALQQFFKVLVANNNSCNGNCQQRSINHVHPGVLGNHLHSKDVHQNV